MFHERLRLAVKESGLTVGRLAEKSGVKKRTIDRWLGQNPPVPNVLEFSYVAKTLGYSVDYFVFGIENNDNPARDVRLLGLAQKWHSLLETIDSLDPIFARNIVSMVMTAPGVAKGAGGMTGEFLPRAEGE